MFAVDLDEKAKLAYTGSGDKVNTLHVVYAPIMEYSLDNQTMGDSGGGRCFCEVGWLNDRVSESRGLRGTAPQTL